MTEATTTTASSQQATQAQPEPGFRWCGFRNNAGAECDIVIGMTGDRASGPGFVNYCSRHNTPEKRRASRRCQ